jgi:hypothetical protein
MAQNRDYTTASALAPSTIQVEKVMRANFVIQGCVSAASLPGHAISTVFSGFVEEI